MAETENTATEQQVPTAPVVEEEEGPASSLKKPKCLFDKITVSFYSVIMFVMCILLTVIISAATIMRYILKMDLYGYEEWVKIFAFWLYFMGAAYGAFCGTHISADLIQAYLKGFTKRLLLFVKTSVTLGVTALFTWWGWGFFMFGLMGPLGTGVAIPKTVAWRIPLWTCYASILIGLVSMTYYFFWDWLRATRNLFTGGKAEQ